MRNKIVMLEKEIPITEQMIKGSPIKMRNDIDHYNRLLSQRKEIQEQIDSIEKECVNAKLFHIDGYIKIYSGEGLDTIDDILRYIDAATGISIELSSSDSRDILWHDNIDLNRCDCPIENYKKYFEKK